MKQFLSRKGRTAFVWLLAAALAFGALPTRGVGAGKVYAASAPTATGGIQTVTVVAHTAGSEIRLYRTPNTPVESKPAGVPDPADLTVKFTGLTPGEYFATEVDSGGESAASDFVAVAPSAVTVTGGVNEVVVSDAMNGATVKLYKSDGTLAGTDIYSAPGPLTFPDIEPGVNYYATQTVNAIPGPSSNLTTVSPSPVTIANGLGSVTVSGADVGATLKLYRTTGPLAGTYPLVGAEQSHTFTDVAGVFYATQTVNGVESAGSAFGVAAPAMLAITGGVEQLTVTNPYAGAKLQLYRLDGVAVGAPYTLGASETSHEYAAVEPGSYYVTQTVDGVVNDGSNIASVVPRVVTAIGGAGQVGVTGATAGATLRLHASNGTQVGADVVLDGADTVYTFGGIDPGFNYYVSQAVNGFESDGSNLVTVTPTAAAATGGIGRITVTGATEGALLKLYAENGTPTGSTHTLGAGETSYAFEGVAPGAYYATQTVNGVESVNTNIVTSAPPSVSAVGGVGTLAVSGATEGAKIVIHSADGAPVLNGEFTLIGSATGYTFTGVSPGLGYYATQTVNGIVSVGSSPVTVSPDVVTVTGGAGQLVVNGAMGGAEVTVYAGNGTSADAYELEAGETSHTFSGLMPGTNYYATQTIGGAESAASNLASVSPAAVTVRGGAHRVTVDGATPGAAVQLYAADGSPADAPYTLAVGETSHTFSGLEPGLNYYATQAVGGVESIASALVSVAPDKPVLSGGASRITVSGATAGAMLTLYAEDDSVAATYALGAGETSYAFASGIRAGAAYRASQTVNGVESEWAGPVRAYTPVVDRSVSDDDADRDVLVNGKPVSVGARATSQRGNQSVLTVTVDPKKLGEQLAGEGDRPIVTIPFLSGQDVAVAELNAASVRELQSRGATLVVQTPEATYTLPASAIKLDELTKSLGADQPERVSIRLEIAKPDEATAALTPRAAEAGKFALLLPPTSFSVTAATGDRSVEQSTFGSYVERAIALPDGLAAQSVSTGVVLEADGSARHVPTRVVTIDGRAYAIVSSLTNSIYAIVAHPIAFTDVEGHWAQAAVNDMGSRMIIQGTGAGSFQPSLNVTRAEFAAIVVRALGLKAESGAAPFKDVSATDWYSANVSTASSYGLIEGYADGTFRPNASVTREQAMAIISKAMKLTGLAAMLPSGTTERTLLPFRDGGEASAWAKDAIANVLKAGVVSGISSMKLAPQASISRAEVAVIVQRLLRKSGLI